MRLFETKAGYLFRVIVIFFLTTFVFSVQIFGLDSNTQPSNLTTSSNLNSLSLTAVVNPPLANLDSATVSLNQTTNIDTLSNDTSWNNENLTITNVAPPTNASASILTDNNGKKTIGYTQTSSGNSPVDLVSPRLVSLGQNSSNQSFTNTDYNHIYKSSITPDGKYLLFSSNKLSVLETSSNACSNQLYRKNLETGEVVWITSFNVQPGCKDDQDYANFQKEGSISNNGRFVAFTSHYQLSSQDPDAKNSVYIKDLITNQYNYLENSNARNSNDLASQNRYSQLQISGNGEYVVYKENDKLWRQKVADGSLDIISSDSSCQMPSSSDDSNTIAYQCGGRVFAKTMSTGAVFGVDTTVDGAQSNGSSTKVSSVSGDGKVVVFSSTANNLVSNENYKPLGSVSVYAKFLDPVENGKIISLDTDQLGNRKDNYRCGNQTNPTLNQCNALGYQSFPNSGMASISADGKWAVFESQMDFGITGCNLDGDGFKIYLKNLETGKLQRISNTSSQGNCTDTGHQTYLSNSIGVTKNIAVSSSNQVQAIFQSNNPSFNPQSNSLANSQIQLITYQSCPNGFVYTAQNVSGGYQRGAVCINLSNPLPTIGNLSKNIAQDSVLNFTINDFNSSPTFTSTNGNIAKLKITSLPTHGNLKINSALVSLNTEIFPEEIQMLTYQPNSLSYTGLDSFDWNASDSFGYSPATAKVNITITATNNKPVVTSFGKNVFRIDTLIFTNTDFTSKYADLDNSPLQKIKIISLPGNGNLELNHATVALNKEILANDLSKFRYIPNGSNSTNDAFLWSASDGTDYAGTPASVNISIQPNPTPICQSGNTNQPTNQSVSCAILFVLPHIYPPIASNDSSTTTPTSPITINFISNDYPTQNGANLDLNSITITQNPSKGTVEIINGEFVYTPNSAEFPSSGSDSFSYTIKDSNGTLSNQATVDIKVSIDNQPPSTNPQSINGKRDQLVIFNPLSGTDPDNNTPLKFLVGNLPANLTCTNSQGTSITNSELNSNEVITCKGSLVSSLGTKVFSVTPKDSKGLTGSSVVFGVNVGNNPPVGTDLSAQMDQNTTKNLNLISNVTDTDGIVIPSTIAITQQPSHGSLVINANGTVDFTPASGYFGVDSFRYKIKDNDGDYSNEITVNLAIKDTTNCILNIYAIPEKRVQSQNSTLVELNFYAPSLITSTTPGSFLGTALVRTDASGNGQLNVCQLTDFSLINNITYNIFAKGYSHLNQYYPDVNIRLSPINSVNPQTNDFNQGGQKTITHPSRPFSSLLITDNSLNNKRNFLAGETSGIFDNYINSLDISTQVSNYNSTNNEKNDLNGDGVVNSLDISMTSFNVFTEGQK